MKRLIKILLLTVFCVSLISQQLFAAQWDPAIGPNWPEQRYVERVDFSGDEGGWHDVESGGGDDYDWLNFRLIRERIFNFFIFFMIENNDGIVNDNPHEDIEQNRGVVKD